MAKSYHSIRLPIMPAMTTRRRALWMLCAVMTLESWMLFPRLPERSGRRGTLPAPRTDSEGGVSLLFRPEAAVGASGSATVALSCCRQERRRVDQPRSWEGELPLAPTRPYVQPRDRRDP